MGLNFHKIWLMFDPRRAVIGMGVGLFALAIIIHFVLLSTERYNWFAVGEHAKSGATTMVVPAPNRNPIG